MKLSVLGTSHRTAPVDVRERFALPAEAARDLLRSVRAESTFDEALVLDTCNRTEIYLVADSPRDCMAYMHEHYQRLKQVSMADYLSAFYCYHDLAAAEHLFRVAASLDSQIVGEDQIIGQVKGAYRMAVSEGSAGLVMHRLLHRAMCVSKQVRTETQLSSGAVSVPQAAVELARQVFAPLAGKSVMLVGAGKTAELAARNLAGCGVGHIVVANRTLSRAQQLAAELLEGELGPCLPAEQPEPAESLLLDGVCVRPLRSPDEPPACPTAGPLTTEAISLEGIPQALLRVNMMICSAGSPDPVLTWENCSRILRRLTKPLLIIDIALPRNVDPRLNALSNVFLYNLDNLNALVTANLDRRRREIPQARAIIEHERQSFGRWLDSLTVVPIIKLLQQHFEQLRSAEIKRYGHQFSDNEQLELFAQSLCKKILYKPLVFLRYISQENDGPESQAAMEVIRQMFDLDSIDEQNGTPAG